MRDELHWLPVSQRIFYYTVKFHKRARIIEKLFYAVLKRYSMQGKNYSFSAHSHSYIHTNANPHARTLAHMPEHKNAKLLSHTHHTPCTEDSVGLLIGLHAPTFMPILINNNYIYIYM